MNSKLILPLREVIPMIMKPVIQIRSSDDSVGPLTPSRGEIFIFTRGLEPKPL